MEHPEGEDYSRYRVPLNDMLNLIDTLILGIELPSDVVDAINRKIEQYYVAEEYKSRVVREARESERKKIEAQGIREFRRIVTQGIADSYLRWRGIEATVQLAQSSNTKIVIVGSGKDGLPLIFGKTPAGLGEKEQSGKAGGPPERAQAQDWCRPGLSWTFSALVHRAGYYGPARHPKRKKAACSRRHDRHSGWPD